MTEAEMTETVGMDAYLAEGGVLTGPAMSRRATGPRS